MLRPTRQESGITARTARQFFLQAREGQIKGRKEHATARTDPRPAAEAYVGEAQGDFRPVWTTRTTVVAPLANRAPHGRLPVPRKGIVHW